MPVVAMATNAGGWSSRRHQRHFGVKNCRMRATVLKDGAGLVPLVSTALRGVWWNDFPALPTEPSGVVLWHGRADSIGFVGNVGWEHEGKAVVVLMVCRYPLNLLTALLLLLVLKAGDASWI